MISQKCCIVDDIIDHRQNFQGRYQFLIKWKRSSPTWQPFDNLQAVNDLIEKYFTRRKINYDQWNKSKLNDQIIQNGHIFQQEKQIDETNKHKCSNSLQSCQNLVLKFDDHFKKPYAQKRFIKKHTQQPFTCLQVKKSIQFQNIQRALSIKKDSSSSKWIVLVQFYSKYQQNIWIDRDILRLTNPFTLLQLYQRMERQQIIKQFQRLQQSQCDFVDDKILSQSVIQIQDAETDVEPNQQANFVIQIED